MLVCKRKEGQWVEVPRKSGDVLRIRVYRIREGNPGGLDMAFDDDARNFKVVRPEKVCQVHAIEEAAPDA